MCNIPRGAYFNMDIGRKEIRIDKKEILDKYII